MNGCTTPMDFIASVKYFPNGNITPEDKCNGNDPFATQDDRQELQLSTPQATFTLQLPKNVYSTADSTKGTDAENGDYIRGTKNRCNNAINENSKPEEILACKFLFIVKGSFVLFTVGSFKLKTNVLNAVSVSGFGKDMYTTIFDDRIVAELLSNNCIDYNGAIGEINREIVEYSSEKSYQTAVDRGNSLDVSGTVGYGPVSVSAG